MCGLRCCFSWGVPVPAYTNGSVPLPWGGGQGVFHSTVAGRFLTRDSAHRFSEPVAHLGGGTQSSPSGVRSASSWGSNVVSSLVPPGIVTEGLGISNKRLRILGILD